MMKKLIRCVLLAALMLVFSALFTACTATGSVINTTLNLNEDMSGSRVMDIAVTQSTFNEHFNGTYDDLDAAVTASCPEGITWSRDGSPDTGMTYHAQLDFSSLDDYREKVGKILGREPSIEIAAPDSVWSSGIRAVEDFSSEDLLSGVLDTLVDSGLISSDSRSYVFSSGQVVVNYNSNTYESGSSHVDVEEISSIALNGINIMTTVHGDNTYDRTVEVDIPNASMAIRSEAIKEYMNGVVPDGAEIEWTEEENSQICRISGNGLSADGLKTFTDTVLDTETTTENQTEIGPTESAFLFAGGLEEKMDFSSYTGGVGDGVNIGYYMNCDEDLLLADGTPESYTRYQTFSDEKPDYYRINYGNSLTMKYNTLVVKPFIVKSIDSTTKIKGGDNFSRTINFVFDKVPSEEDQSRIVDALKNSVSASDDTEEESDASDVAESTAPVESESADEASTEAVSTKAASTDAAGSDKSVPEITGNADEDKFTITVKMSGSGSEICRDESYLFRTGGQVLRYAQESSAYAPRVTAVYEELTDMSGLVRNTSADFTYTENAKLWPGCSFDRAEQDLPDTAGSQEGTQYGIRCKGNTLTQVMDTPDSGVRRTAVVWNLRAVILWLIFAVVTVLCIVGMIRTGFFKALGEKRQAAREAAGNQQPYTPDGQPNQQPYTPDVPPEQPAENEQPDVSAQPEASVQPAEPDASVQSEQPAQPENNAALSDTPAEVPKIRFCRKCGAKLEPGSRFCENCGAKIE